MDLGHLRSFIAVARHGHLTRASETLHLSQPALSAQIKALEEDLEVTLFQRSPSGMILTPSGRRLLERAEEVIVAVQALRQSADALNGAVTGHLKVGTVLDAATLRIGELLNRAMEQHPQIELELHHVVSHEALLGLRSGSLDASFYFGARPDDLESVALREITYNVTVPVSWAVPGRELAWHELADRPWVVAPPPSSHRQLVLETFQGRSAPPEHIIEVDNESVIANLVESGVGASVLRSEIALASARQGRMTIWSNATVVTTLWLVFRRSRNPDPVLDALVALVREIWAAKPVALAA
ncbi:MAG: LysR family transcriptional regulator [Pseudomonadota bacterium]|nr:LysR family transcriptional regulator [Pseudomonadota bacterium]